MPWDLFWHASVDTAKIIAMETKILKRDKWITMHEKIRNNKVQDNMIVRLRTEYNEREKNRMVKGT